MKGTNKSETIKGKELDWWVDHNELIIRKEDGTMVSFSTSEVKKMEKHFSAKGSIHLDNSVHGSKEMSREDIPDWGLGRFIYHRCSEGISSNAKKIAKGQASSQLAAILLDCHLVDWNGQKRNALFKVTGDSWWDAMTK